MKNLLMRILKLAPIWSFGYLGLRRRMDSTWAIRALGASCRTRQLAEQDQEVQRNYQTTKRKGETMKRTTLLIATILLLTGTLSAQEFAVAKVTCVEPYVGPTILAARVTGSPFEGAHELRVSPKQCPTAELPTDNLSGWSVSQAWVNQLSQVDADWEVGLSTRGDSAEVNARIADLFERLSRIR